MNNAMRMFKHDLAKHLPYVVRMARVHACEITSLPNDEFTLVVSWDGGSFRRTYTRQYVLGRSSSMIPTKQAPRMRTCRFRDDFIRDVLDARCR